MGIAVDRDKWGWDLRKGLSLGNSGGGGEKTVCRRDRRGRGGGGRAGVGRGGESAGGRSAVGGPWVGAQEAGGGSWARRSEFARATGSQEAGLVAD